MGDEKEKTTVVKKHESRVKDEPRKWQDRKWRRENNEGKRTK